MPEASFGIAPSFFKELLSLETDMEYLTRVAGPRANVMALNKVKVTMRKNLTNAIWASTKTAAPLITAQGIMIPSGSAKAKLKRGTILRRVYIRPATIKRDSIGVKGYVNPIPAASALATTKMVEGKKRNILKGSYKYKHTPGKRAKDQTVKRGGVRIKGITLTNGFVQISSKNNTVQIYTRMQEKTWRPGKSGWKVPPGSVQTHLRMPYDVVKIFIEEAFNKNFHPQIQRTMEERYELEYFRALGTTAGRIMAKS